MIENNFSFYRALLEHENTSNKWMNERDVYLSTTQGRRTSRQSSVEKNSFTRGNEWENHRLLLLLFSVPPHFDEAALDNTAKKRQTRKLFNLFRFSLSSYQLLSISNTFCVCKLPFHLEHAFERIRDA